MLKDQPSTAADGVVMSPSCGAARVSFHMESRQVLSLQVKARHRRTCRAFPQALLDTLVQVASRSSCKGHREASVMPA